MAQGKLREEIPENPFCLCERNWVGWSIRSSLKQYSIYLSVIARSPGDEAISVDGGEEDETPPYNPTEIAAALRASQRREERRCVAEHLNEYKGFTIRE